MQGTDAELTEKDEDDIAAPEVPEPRLPTAPVQHPEEIGMALREDEGVDLSICQNNPIAEWHVDGRYPNDSYPELPYLYGYHSRERGSSVANSKIISSLMAASGAECPYSAMYRINLLMLTTLSRLATMEQKTAQQLLELGGDVGILFCGKSYVHHHGHARHLQVHQEANLAREEEEQAAALGAGPAGCPSHTTHALACLVGHSSKTTITSDLSGLYMMME
ncbi:hypothetical protein F4778DRAFT_787640 [Xylariomycetidae sp. FL2044]|nr:hypothetical protein F4778DRAFT_787640 [Xylariomycetidae sp. FL2044]